METFTTDHPRLPPYMLSNTDLEGDDRGNDVLVFSRQPIFDQPPQQLFIAWQPLIALAAESLAKSFGARLGENLADSFTQALLGNHEDPSAAFQAEVLHRLDVIEKKIDLVLDILRTLPDIVRDATREVFVEENKRSLSVKGATIAALISGNNDRTALEKLILKEALGTLELGLKLLGYGPPLYVSAITAFGAALPAFSFLMKIDKGYGKSLGRYAVSYLTALRPLVAEDGSKGSFKTDLRRLNDELAAAKPIVATLPTGPFIMAVAGGVHFDIPPGGSVLSLAPGWYWSWTPFAAQVDAGANGSWRRGQWVKHPEGAPGGWNPTTNKIDPPPPELFGWRYLDWWTPSTEAYSEEALWAVWGTLQAKAATAVRRDRENPKMIEECNIAISAIVNLIECCERLSLLAPKE